jgi:ssDNA-binding Zn-finger/Zn-ribbon topoisomerase 1
MEKCPKCGEMMVSTTPSSGEKYCYNYECDRTLITPSEGQRCEMFTYTSSGENKHKCPNKATYLVRNKWVCDLHKRTVIGKEK